MIPNLQKAIEAIHQKECIVFPTETVYGLGADATCKEAVLKIFELKNRPSSNPIITHVSDIESIFSIAKTLNKLEYQLFEHFSPGPLSLILPKKSNIPLEVTGGLDSIAVRIPNHPVALAFLKEVNTPICAPSANLSGQPSPTTFEMAKYYMGTKVPIILDGGQLDIGIESTVIKVEQNNIYILRAGFITAEMIKELTGIIPQYPTNQLYRSPGTQFAHYKPKAKVIIFEQGEVPNTIHNNSAILYLSPSLNTENYNYKIHFLSTKDYAQALYYSFFNCDKKKIDYIYCELPLAIHQGIALKDRLHRAAQ